MPLHIMSDLASELEDAFRTVETVSLKTRNGHTYRIEIARSLFSSVGSHSARVTRGEQARPVGVCYAYTLEDASEAAQRLVADDIARNNRATRELGDSIPAPHISMEVLSA